MRVRQSDIARRVGLDVSSVNQILNLRPGSSFSKKKIREVFRVARELGYDLGRLKYSHIRRADRRNPMIPVELFVYRPDGMLYDRGTAMVRNLSNSGALLISLVLSRQAIPLSPHMIGLRALGTTVPLPEVLGRAVRFDYVGTSMGLAVEFLESQAVNAADLQRKFCPGPQSKVRPKKL